MVEVLDHNLAQAQRDGFGGLRGFVEMGWGVKSPKLIDYEHDVSALVQRYQDAVVCFYDPAACGARLVADLMAVHPKVIVDGKLGDNPYWKPATSSRRTTRG